MRDIAMATSTDGGRTFSPLRASARTIGSCPVVPMMDRRWRSTHAASHLAWPTLVNDAAPQKAIFYTSTTDGRSFAPRIRLSGVDQEDAAHPQIAVDSAGDVAVVWDEQQGNDRKIVMRVARSAEGNSARAEVLNASGSALHPSSVAAAGFLVAWPESRMAGRRFGSAGSVDAAMSRQRQFYFFVSMAFVQMSISSGVIVPSGHLSRIEVVPPFDVHQVLRAGEQRPTAKPDAFVGFRFVLCAIEQLVDDLAGPARWGRRTETGRGARASTRQCSPKRASSRGQSMSCCRARIRCRTSAPSKRSRSIRNALDQIISSIGINRTGKPSDSSRTACVNHSSSTSATPLPPEKIRSTKNSRSRPPNALPSQCGKVSSVANAFFLERRCHDVPVAPPDEEVEIFRVPADSGVADERERATDEKIDAFLPAGCR